MFRNFFILVGLLFSFSLKADLNYNGVVSKVYISDAAYTKKISYDDPIYLNRIFQWKENDIKTNIYSGEKIETCLSYKINKFVVNFDDILNKKMAKNNNEILTTKSFDIDIKQSINQIDIFCPNINRTWTLFEKNANEYLIINTYDSILEIKRMEHQSIEPSFSCSIAKKLSENLICQNIYLSELDRSIHDIYYNIKKYYGYNNDQKAFKEIYSNQKKFIKKRDLCKDENCLMDIMYKHAYELHEYMPLVTPY
ncbi:hypothetical protein [Gilliamella sp. Pas-s27]|uniref:hypothetical protein n=1 Tax=Gilliamella sp. Pas-s27 TaxID=2687311 RepID=UPI0013652C39|nr:hypothetical protein [Gilliamella sp. Pas-s27]MWP48053.1 hypothetical protein [Gilliamella sp. Pas-s27]